ncbi:MAG: M6 family metalloprotease domain-containing protein [Muribaculaceae bacterium]|nr:M6 family metalloprotease domain-containing protein [Muribaculaceae bacterium]
MKKHFLALAAAVLALGAAAVPANPTPVAVSQPDGTTLTLMLCGDEYYHFNTTTDGYTVVQDSHGRWVYATLAGSDLRPTTVMAHDVGWRTATERALTASLPARLTGTAHVERAKAMRAAAHPVSRVPAVDFDRVRGLIILVEPSDVSFSMGDNTRAFYNAIVNGKNLTRVPFGDYGEWTGSVRDYFYDNTLGHFDPHFDIVGPVKINHESNTLYYTAINNPQPLIDALNAVDSSVDFSVYDCDGNGVVDNVAFVVAGFSSNYSGNDPGLMWPHANRNYVLGYYDGKTVKSYFCATEMGGWVSTGNTFVEGIGTFCHEFSHILGFQDLYDTNYATNGQSHDPDEWDIMATGLSFNHSRTPAGYSLYERYTLALANVSTIDQAGNYTLEPFAESNTGFIIKSPVNNEFFLVENRQQTSKWDAYLPGHGLLVTRVDSTNTSMWTSNNVNSQSSHNYYELKRAFGSESGSHDFDAFPGTRDIANLTNTTATNLKTWHGYDNAFSLIGIRESNGVISFEVIDAGSEREMTETFNNVPLKTGGNTLEAAGDLGKWRFSSQCQITSDSYSGSGRMLRMKANAVAQTLDPISTGVKQVAFTAHNASTDSAAVFTLEYSDNNGVSWTQAKTYLGDDRYIVQAGESQVVYWDVELATSKARLFRISIADGNSETLCDVDNLTILCKEVTSIKGDIDNSCVIDIADVNAAINIILGLEPFNANGDLDENGTVDIGDVNALINILLGGS